MNEYGSVIKRPEVVVRLVVAKVPWYLRFAYWLEVHAEKWIIWGIVATVYALAIHSCTRS